MSDDPLAAYRRERWKANDMEVSGQEPEPLTEHEALKLAIDALNQIPNRSLRSEKYRNTYDLIPALEKAYRGAEPDIRGMTAEAGSPEPGRLPEPDIEMER